MAHEIAKLLLEHADTFHQRSEAVKQALDLGMPLHEIEGYLDWLEMVRKRPSSNEHLNDDEDQLREGDRRGDRDQPSA